MGGVGSGNGNSLPKFLAQKLGKDKLKQIAGKRNTAKYCLNCGSSLVYYRTRTRDFRCKECGWISGVIHMTEKDLEDTPTEADAKMVEIVGLHWVGGKECQ